MGKMSAKRRPGNDLNHDNWDDDQDQEESGEFRKASSDELKQRTMRVAKRRIATSATGGGGDDATDGAAKPTAASVFGSFTGFGKPAASTAAAASPFSFLSGGSTSSSSTATPFGGPPAAKMDFAAAAANFNSTVAKPATLSTDAAYHAQLKGLNLSVAAWIAKHIGENPVCILTPIFDDYARHLKDIERNRSGISDQGGAGDGTASSKPDVKEAAKPTTVAAAAVKTTFSFGAAAANASGASQPTAEPKETAPATSVKSTFSFGLAKSPPKDVAATAAAAEPVAKPPATSSTFSFGSLAPSSSTSTSTSFGGNTGFSFGGAGSKPFTFANIKTPADHAREAAEAGGSTAAANAATDDDNEEPPKNEFTPVVEEDSLYKQRCKVFVKAAGGSEYVDRGVGQLFIKAVDGKTQLLVRADTNLGNVVLNILLSEAVPASRMGKNNVMLICVPTPATDGKASPPSTVLVRVKGADEADELLAQIEKHKK